MVSDEIFLAKSVASAFPSDHMSATCHISLQFFFVREQLNAVGTPVFGYGHDGYLPNSSSLFSKQTAADKNIKSISVSKRFQRPTCHWLFTAIDAKPRSNLNIKLLSGNVEYFCRQRTPT